MENYHRKQAADCAHQAAATSLAQARERNLRAEQVWLVMADRGAGGLQLAAKDGEPMSISGDVAHSRPPR